MEKQTKLRFNLVDVLFILVVLAGIAFVVMRLGGLDVVARITGAASPEPYAITFICEEVPDYVAERIEVGARVTDDEASMNLGTVVDVQLNDALSYNPDVDGKLMLSAKEGYYSVVLTCKTQGAEASNGATVDGLLLGLGHTMVVRAGEAKMYMVVYDIQKLADSPYADK